MSYRNRRGSGWCILALAVLCAPLGLAQEMKPAANLLIPYFEIRLPDPNASSLVDTAMGLVNARAEQTEVEYTVYTNWGIPVLQFTDTLRRTEPRVIDLENWIVSGELPHRTLGEAELAELHAALSGNPSPTDHLYRGTLVEPTLAVGYVIMRALDGEGDVLWGDTYIRDPMTDFFQGETLAVLDDNLDAQCSRHAIRFVDRAELFEGTEFVIWTGAHFEPSPTPEPIGAKVTVESDIYDELGNHVSTSIREFIATQTIPARDLDQLPEIGWIDMKFDRKTHVAEHLHSASAASAELHAWCLPSELELRGGPGIQLEKFVNQIDADKAPGALVAVGAEILFEYHVKNTGSVPLLNIAVTDSEELAVSCPRTSLEPGESMVCSARTVAEPCAHKNMGMATGHTASGREVKDRDPGWYTGTYAPAIELEKRVNGDEADSEPGLRINEGQGLTFTFELTNTGDATLAKVKVEDSAGMAVTCPAETLEPGASMTCTTATIGAAVGEYGNTATVTADDPCGVEVTASDAAHYYVPAENRPGIDVEKYANGDDADTPPGPVVPIGSMVQFRYVVTNTGNVPLTDVEMEDEHFLTCTTASLAAGESFQCGSSIYAVAGQHQNLATVHGHFGEQTVEDEDSAHYLGSNDQPGIDIEKYVNGVDADYEYEAIYVLVGSALTFTFEVKNTGTLPLTSLQVADSAGLDVSCPKTALDAGESMTCTASATAGQGLHANVGTVSGMAGVTPIGDSDPANYFGGTSRPAIGMEKLVNGEDADTPSAAVQVPTGSSLLFSYVVTNTGDVQLSSIAVTDDQGLTVTCPKTALEPGESMTCTATATAVAGSHQNVGTATGTPPEGPVVTSSDPANYVGRTASIALEKYVNKADADTEDAALHVLAGSTLQFTYVVTNTGELALSSVGVTDNTGLVVTCPKTALEPGESMTCTASTTAATGLHTNIGTASGTPSGGPSVSANDPASYIGDIVTIDVEKFVNDADADSPETALHVLAASSLTFTYVVTNTGTTQLTGVAVTDDTGLAVTCPKAVLDPAESMVCSAKTSALGGAHANIGTATGTPTDGPSVSDSDPANYFGESPAIRIEKLVNGEEADTPSTAVSVALEATLLFTYVVTNAGDVQLTSVTVTDNRLPAVTCPKSTLQPGETMTCTATTTAASGLVGNIGTAKGTPPTGPDVTATDPAYYDSGPVGDQGCTPGYWKNHTGSWPPTGYSTSQAVDSVFGNVNTYYPTLGNATLLQALGFGGGPGNQGAAEILLRAAVAALLNASHPSVAYPRTAASVLSDVNAALLLNRDSMLALAAALDADNNRGCPLN